MTAIGTSANEPQIVLLLDEMFVPYIITNLSYHKCTLLHIIKFSLPLVKSSHQVRVISKWLLLCINGKESSLIPTLRSKNLANILTECFSLLQGKSEED